MTVRQKQSLFIKLLARLIDKAYELGYELTGGDLFSLESYLAHKINSLHYIRLAIDLNLFRDGVWLRASADHRPLGEFWESLHPLCRWGGRYGDGNHYEFIDEVNNAT